MPSGSQLTPRPRSAASGHLLHSVRKDVANHGRQASSVSLINRRELVDSIQGFKTVHPVAGGSTGPDCTGTPRRSSPLFSPPFVFCFAIIGGGSMVLDGF